MWWWWPPFCCVLPLAAVNVRHVSSRVGDMQAVDAKPPSKLLFSPASLMHSVVHPG